MLMVRLDSKGRREIDWRRRSGTEKPRSSEEHLNFVGA
jgi:hypothetical protein